MKDYDDVLIVHSNGIVPGVRSNCLLDTGYFGIV